MARKQEGVKSEYAKHLKKFGKRIASKGSRKASKMAIKAL